MSMIDGDKTMSFPENENNGSELYKLFRKDFLENKKTYLYELLVAWGICILLGSFMGIAGRGGGMGELIAFYIAIHYISNVYSSLSFSNMKHKSGRIATLMLPVSCKEKYIMKWFMAVPVMFAVGIIGYYLGDASRMIAAWLADSRSCPSYFHVPNPFYSTDSEVELLIFIAFTSYFFSQALYLLGSILWPKLSFIKTFAVLYVLQMIIGIIFLVCVKFIYKFMVIKISSDILVPNLLICLCVIQIILTFVIYWFTYIRFRRSEVVYRLF
ncbi:MAG: hypothetical protein K2G90_05710 [Muribaculaceae bacterium]|nr:hypothetical protein [Muribaculaceae bacterium]